MKNEELLSKQNAINLWESGSMDNIEIGTLKGLKEIHYYLFQNIFDFAGQLRTVNIAKGNFRFCPIIFLVQNAKIIDKMPMNTFDEIIDKYTEMNILHPFREGNGRATRIWLDLILKNQLSKCVVWEKINKYDYLSAMERSPVNNIELKILIKSALTNDINNRQIYMRGVQQSFFYENINEYDISDLSDDNTP